MAAQSVILFCTVLASGAGEQPPQANRKDPAVIAQSPAPRPKLPPKHGPQFSQTQEVTLSIGYMKYLLDLDTGQTMDPPMSHRPGLERTDVSPIQNQGYEVPVALRGHSLQGLQVKPADWNASASDVKNALAGGKLRQLDRMQRDRFKPAMFFFRTQGGTEGILQISPRVQIFDGFDPPSENKPPRARPGDQKAPPKPNREWEEPPAGAPNGSPAARTATENPIKGLLIRYKTVQH